MNITQQSQISRMYNFFCALHLLVSFAEVSTCSLKKFEETWRETPIGILNDKYLMKYGNKSESSIIRLVRSSCKAFSRGNEKSSCYLEFKTYLAECNEKLRHSEETASTFYFLIQKCFIVSLITP